MGVTLINPPGDVSRVFEKFVERAPAILVGRDWIEGLQVLGGGAVIGGSLGLVLVLDGANVLAVPSVVPLGLLAAGLSIPALANGYREGGVGVSWLATGLGTVPVALAFAPSGPFTLPLGAVLVKAAWWTVVLGLVVGSLFHGVGWVVRRAVAGGRRPLDLDG